MKDLEKEIQGIVLALRSEKKEHLAKIIEENWDKTLLEYSKNLHSYRTNQPLEDIFKKALSIELTRLGYDKKEVGSILKYAEKNRTLQTASHMSPGGKPRFFFINWLDSLSLSQKDFFLVAMFSGVPFSNKTRPGRLCKKDGDINLIPSSMQDELVYRSKITPKMVEVINNLPAKLKTLLPEAKERDSYTAWALKSSQSIESKFLHGKPVFFDFNEVASNYLLFAIENPKHSLSKIFFSKPERILTIKNFKEMVFFYGPVKKGKYKEMENFFLKDGYLESPSRKIQLTPKILAEELKNGLCPGLIVGFLIFSFLNHFQCSGSFAQVEYLPLYREKFATFPFLKKNKIKEASAESLTTGGFPFDVGLHPLDIHLGEKFTPDPNALFGEAMLAIKDVLLHQNYSMNLVRK
ncbi:MAG: hypothetical protein P4L63_01600 [Candidatus Pacebacteria bacterium]|nr:hypothetical protein [Candidatus Paceibacterota bacterium]